MEWFIPVEIFWKKSNTFRGITFFPFLPRQPKFFVIFVWLMSARLPLRGKMICFNPGPLVIWCFANGTTPTHSLFQKCFQVHYHLSEIFYQNSPRNGKHSGFFLGGGAQLRNGVTDCWHKQILKANTRIPVVLESHRSSQGGGRGCALQIHNPTTCPGQNSWDTNAIALQTEASFPLNPPPPSPCSVRVTL